MKISKHLIQFLIGGIIIFSVAHAQSNQKDNAEQRIRNFWAGFEKKDWNLVAGQLTQDFTFTSPNNDDHISSTKFKERCWATGIRVFKKIEFQKIVISGNTALVMYNITDTNNKVAHNVEYYTFRNGKIKSSEVFFGVGVGYSGNTSNVK